MTLPHSYIGVDVAKDWIDVFHSSSCRHERIPTDSRSLRRFAQSVGQSIVVLEASGGYERPIMSALARAGRQIACVNPRQAREFARATGQLAKTDRVDARVLAEMGRSLDLRITAPQDPDRARLADLVARREDLCAMLRAEQNRLRQAREVTVRQDISSMVRVLSGRVEKLERQIAAHLAACDKLARDARRLQTMPGVGPLLSATILAQLPELGRLRRREIAALAGLAPHACDSGLHRGRRRIWGGRAAARRALYLAAFIAGRYDPRIKTYRRALQDRGKPTKVAIVACARKLLAILNAMLRDGVDYRSQET